MGVPDEYQLASLVTFQWAGPLGTDIPVQPQHMTDIIILCFKHIKNILVKCWNSNVWIYQMFPYHIKRLVANVKQKLSDLFLNDWYCTESSKYKNYRLFKETFHFEPYLTNIPKKTN
jgi:hypothetical protein